MVPRAAARAALASPPSALAPLIESARDADVEGFYLSPSSARRPARTSRRSCASSSGATPWTACTSTSSATRAATTTTRGRRCQAFRAQRGRGWLLDGPEADPAGFERHRRDALDALVARLARAARATRPSVVVSAAVVPEETAMRAKGQDWPRWIASGTLDAAGPDGLHAGHGQFVGQILALRRRLGPRAALWAGIGAYRLDAGERGREGAGRARRRRVRASSCSRATRWTPSDLRPAARRGVRPRAARPADGGLSADAPR